KELRIDCSGKGLTEIPALPIPIAFIRKTALNFQNNSLQQLPNNTLKGYYNLNVLDVSKNLLRDLETTRLPKNLAYLDISFNKISTLNNEVMEYLKNVLIFKQFGNLWILECDNAPLKEFFRALSGHKYSLDDDVVDFLLQNKVFVNLKKNPWKCDCKSRKFLFFLRDYDPEEYNLAIDRCNIPLEDCPSSCVCCLNTSVWTSFIVDCREQGLLNVPEISDNVTYLDLRNNSITGMTIMDRDMLDRKGHGAELKLFLSGNPWTCECIDLDFVFFMKNISKNIEDFSDVKCLGIEKAVVSVEESDICLSALPYYLTLAISLITVIIFINFLVWLRHPILIWFYEHDICLSLAARQEIDQKKKFDAFLCFTHKDEDLVAEFVERLETSRPRFKLCFYLRDWLLGVSIPDCITNSVRDSRRIIILMTNNFLESTWGRLEFRLALHATSQDRCKRLIVVLYPEVKNFDDLDSELRTYMVFNTYLKRNDPNFWNKLIYSMPHSKLNHNL
ncbi:hypothetical protein KR074_009602, partial [Drosophila pseudoananassae]